MAEHTPTPAQLPWAVAEYEARCKACKKAFDSFDGRQIPTEKIEPGLFWEMRDMIEDLTDRIRATIAPTATPRMQDQIPILAKPRALLAKLEDTEQ